MNTPYHSLGRGVFVVVVFFLFLLCAFHFSAGPTATHGFVYHVSKEGQPFTRRGGGKATVVDRKIVCPCTTVYYGAVY